MENLNLDLFDDPAIENLEARARLAGTGTMFPISASWVWPNPDYDYAHD